MNNIRSSKSHLRIWREAETEWYTSTGIFSKFKPFSNGGRNTNPQFKTNIYEFIETLYESYVIKEADPNQQSLHIEKEAFDLQKACEASKICLDKNKANNGDQETKNQAKCKEMSEHND